MKIVGKTECYIIGTGDLETWDLIVEKLQNIQENVRQNIRVWSQQLNAEKTEQQITDVEFVCTEW